MSRLLSLSLVSLPVSPAFPFSAQPPAGYTGAPPDNMTCAQCHTSQGSGSLTLQFGEGTFNYVPGQTYDLEVLIQDTGQQRFGFSMTARLEDQPSVATGSWTAGERNTVYDAGNHIGHSNAPFGEGSQAFRMMWTAPAENVGDIVFYAAANAANGNFSNGPGDNVYTARMVVSPAPRNRSFWAQSIIENGWRNTGEGYPDLPGIGWIYDAGWPWILTYAHAGDGADWVYVFPELGDQRRFWGYNYTKGYYFRGYADFGWYYSLEPGNEGWHAYEL